MPDESKADDDLENQMRRNEPYLDNHDFSRRVLSRLPARRNPRRRRRMVKIGAVGVGLVLGALCATTSHGWPDFVTDASQDAVLLTLVPIAVAGLIAAAGYWITRDHA